MRILGTIGRILFLIGIFVGVGIWAAHALVVRGIAQGKPEYEIRLAAYMAGLFIGGSSATAAGVLMLLSGKRSSTTK